MTEGRYAVRELYSLWGAEFTDRAVELAITMFGLRYSGEQLMAAAISLILKESKSKT
jgi:hypothetical protein